MHLRALSTNDISHAYNTERVARVTGLEPATSGVTGRHSNQLSYTRAGWVINYPEVGVE